MPSHPLSDTETPAKLTRGPKWARAAYDALRSFSIRERIISVNPDAGELIKTQNGKLLRIRPPRVQRITYPNQVLAATNTRVFIRYGTVTDFSDNPALAATGMSEGGDPFYLFLSTSGYVSLKVKVNTDLGDVDYGKIIEVTAINTATEQTNDWTTGFYYIALAPVTLSGGNVTVGAARNGGNFGFQLSGELGVYSSLGPFALK